MSDLSDLIALIRAAAPDLPDYSVTAIATRIQRDLGGGYLKKAPAEGKAFRLGAALASGLPLGAAIDELGCSRASAYRYLKRPWRR